MTAVGVVAVVFSVKDSFYYKFYNECVGFYPGLANWMYDNLWLELVASIVSILVMITLICGRHLARKVPINYILLLTFTVCQAYALSCSCIYYAATSPGSVL